MDKQITNKLFHFIENYDNEYPLQPSDWINYYDFINATYNVPQDLRPSVSDLVRIFEDNDIQKPGTLSTIYAHGLYTLARHYNKSIFEGGFNP